MDRHFDGGLHNSSIKVQCAVAELYSCASDLQIKTMGSLFLVVLQLFIVVQLAVGARFSLPNCTDHCGNVQIPYPFGIGANCYHDRSYEIICNASSGPPKPFLREFNLVVLDINWPGRYTFWDPGYYRNDPIPQILTVSLPRPNLCGSDGRVKIRSNDLRGSPYRFSMSANVLMFEGCGGSAVLKQRNGEILAGCASVCASNAFNMTGTTCYGVGCCQASMPQSTASDYNSWRGDIDIYEIDVVFEHLMKMKSDSCNASVALIDSGSLDDFTGSLSSLEFIPTALQWKAINMPSLPNEDDKKAKGANATCYDTDYACDCQFPYEGNPYMPYGCQVVEECRKCKKRCGWNPTNTRQVYYCQKHQLFIPFVGVGGSVVALIVIVFGIYWKCERKRLEIARQNFFAQNGGHLLHQRLSGRDVSVESLKIFTTEELEKATNKYSDSNVVGKGGFGIVYRGTLENNQVVAIKKSLKVDADQTEQFINEVIVLSRLNNRHVVKLLGCCLETELPLLVYEFIDNGTLHEHLHNQQKAPLLKWDIRMKIASQVAEVLSYLHTTISMPIIHRDIKSMNILLDRNYMAKVADFGASRLVLMDQHNLATLVLGTFGYLDPEYLQTSELTQKSDVYSFGVVLVELFTGEYAISYGRPENERCLANFFLMKLKDDRFLEIVDHTIATGDETMRQVKEMANLAKWCLRLKGDKRPTMKEVAAELERISGRVESQAWGGWSMTLHQEEYDAYFRGETVRRPENDGSQNGNTAESSNSQISSLLESLEYGR